MIAQATKTNNGVVTSDEATVQAVVEMLSKNQSVKIYRWTCETCGMIYTGSAPDSCECCGKEASLVHQPDFRREMCSRW